MNRGMIYNDSWAVANGMAGWSGKWKKHDWKMGDLMKRFGNRRL